MQLRLAHREHIGQLPKGSTLVVYPLHDGMRFYRVSEDPDFDYTKPIKEAFLRTYKTGSAVGKSTIVCGHYTNISQPGQHITWLRDPLARDVSHFNYDCKYGHELTKDFAQHLSMMSGNFIVLWLYGKNIGRHDSVSMKSRYETVRKVLKAKFLKVYDSDRFEESWDEVSSMLNIDKEPRLSSNRSNKDYQKIQKLSDLSDEFKVWHRSYNNYDYLLYEEFCK